MPASACIVAPSLDEALRRARRRAAPDALVLAGGTDLMVEMNIGHRRADRVVVRQPRAPSCGRGAHDPVHGTVRIGAGGHLRRARARAARRAAAGTRAGGAHRRLAADPQRGDRSAATSARASPAGDGLPGARRARRDRPPRERRAATRDVPFADFATGAEAHRPAARRADHRRSRSRCSTATRATARSACATRW